MATTLIWNVIESKYEASTGGFYSEDSAQELVEAGFAVYADDVQELNFDD